MGRGLLVVGHGSRRAEANAVLVEMTERVASRLEGFTVRYAYLEIARPTIAEGVAALVEAGCTDLVVHPYFLYPGNHTSADIPDQMRAAVAGAPEITWRMTAPLDVDDRLADLVIDRVNALEA